LPVLLIAAATIAALVAASGRMSLARGAARFSVARQTPNVSVASATPDASGGVTSVWDLTVRQKQMRTERRVGAFRTRDVVTREGR